MRQRHFWRILFIALVCAGLLQYVGWLPFAGRVPAASARAFVIGSDPIDGSTVSKAPSVVRIYFDAPIATASQASVYAFPPGGPSNGLPVNAGKSVINPTNATELDTPLLPASKLPQGSYEVRWTALSMTDGRATSGLIGFNLGASSVGASGTPTLGPSTSNYFPQLDLQGALAVAWDWLTLLALLFWIGILVTNSFLLPRSAPPAFLVQVRKHAQSLSVLCLLALLVGEVINLVLRSTAFTQIVGGGGMNLDVVTQFALNTNYGRLWLLRVALLVAALLFLWWNGSRLRQSQDTSPALVSRTSKSSKNFKQLRQQARPQSSQETTPPASPLAPTLPRSQARVTGAVVANVSQSRGATAALPRITTHFEQGEAPVHEPAGGQKVSRLVLAGLILLTLVLSNEIIQLVPLPLSAGALGWLALAAQACWFGCVAYLGLVLFPLLPATDPDRHAETLVAILKRAVPWLLASIGVLLVSELFLAEATIQTPEQLLTNPYGRALLVRDVLLLGMLLWTGYTLFYLLPRLQQQTVLLPVVDAELPARRARRFALEKTARTIRRALQALAGLAAATLVCLALMNFFAPPVVFPNVNYAALVNQVSTTGSAPTPASQTQQVGGLTATLQVSPARVGVTNTLTLALNDAQGRSVSDATVKLSINMEIMNMGEANTTINGGSPAYTATFNPGQTFTMAGPWTIQVEIDRPQQQAVHLTFHVVVAS